MGVRGLLKRVAFAIATIFVAITINFFLFRVLPGSAITNWARVPNSTPQLQHLLKAQFGLDKPKIDQYFLYLNQLFHGNLGVSFANQQPVLGNLVAALRNTIPLVTIATIIASLLGLWTGVLSARRRGSLVDHASTSVAVVLYALPTQWIGLGFLVLLGRYLPSAGMSSVFTFTTPTPWQHFLDIAKHMILPCATLVLTIYGGNTLIIRSALLEIVGEDFILTARAKGLAPRTIMGSHALRNAVLPIVTLFALSFGYIVAGTILVEIVFTWPGIGSALYNAVVARDYPMMQGGFLVITVSVIFFNLVADILYSRLDPRIRE
ncbi:MAG TPA: ABC transporter permease [Streptosporangiaceae bacterium]|jgi:ABC-type dipeptide/oligopeptide/nickel transport system permease component